jgi:hypothetical protein
MKRFLPIAFVGFILVFSSCKKEDAKLQNADPSTSIFLTKIDRTGEDRLNTNVTMHWNGDDKDGIVTGYEISFDNINWSFTTKQDSTFKFSISGGSDTTDIDFYVRAVDNDNNRDQTPAYLKIPIKNTLPTIALDDDLIKSDTVASVFSILWTANDLDGNETIDSVFIKINSGEWYGVSKNTFFVSVVPVSPGSNGIGEAKIYQGYESQLLSKRIQGLNIGDVNTVYVKVRDVSGAESTVDTLDPFFLKRKTSDLLVIDGYKILVTPDPTTIYLPAITAAYDSFDRFDMYAGGNNIPVVWKPTFSLFLGLYDKVFWYSDNTQNNNSMLLESAAGAIQEYLNNNGKLFAVSDFANNAAPNNFENNSPIFQYAPMDSFQTFFAANQKATIPVDSLIVPDAITGIGYPLLKASSFADAVDPFFPKVSAEIIYSAQIRRTSGVTNTRIICARTKNSSNKTNQVFFSADLYKFLGDADTNGQQDELQKLFEKVFDDEFNW